MRIYNSAGVPVIFEIAKTSEVDLTADFVSPHGDGGKVKCKSTGDLLVHYVGDPANKKTVLTVIETDVWLSDRIDVIYNDAQTTINDANIIFGW